MICKQDANFPYPLLTDAPNSYKDSTFILDVNVEENIKHYRFELIYDIDSSFINYLLECNQAQLILIIQSKDNKFYNIKLGEKYKEVSKSRMSLSNRTTIQLVIRSTEEVCFRDNNDLNSFYDEFKNEIYSPKNSVLGFSNTVVFEGSTSKPLELFEKKVNSKIKSDIEIELGSETIIINYKNEGLQFSNLPMSNTLNNPYVYMGLQKALYRFIVNNGSDDGEVDIEKIDPPLDNLDLKLYTLMRKKMVSELNVENIDEVIYMISDKIIEKFTSAVRGISSNGN